MAHSPEDPLERAPERGPDPLAQTTQARCPCTKLVERWQAEKVSILQPTKVTEENWTGFFWAAAFLVRPRCGLRGNLINFDPLSRL